LIDIAHIPAFEKAAVSVFRPDENAMPDYAKKKPLIGND